MGAREGPLRIIPCSTRATMGGGEVGRLFWPVCGMVSENLFGWLKFTSQASCYRFNWIQSLPVIRMNASWLHLELDLFEIEHWTVPAKPFCLLSLKKRAIINPGQKESSLEQEGHVTRRAQAATTKGKKEDELSQCIFTHLSAPFPSPLTNLPHDAKAGGLLFLLCYTVQPRLSCSPYKLLPAPPYRPGSYLSTFSQAVPTHGSTNISTLFFKEQKWGLCFARHPSKAQVSIHVACFRKRLQRKGGMRHAQQCCTKLQTVRLQSRK